MVASVSERVRGWRVPVGPEHLRSFAFDEGGQGLDDTVGEPVFNYEEYHPYGSTSWWASNGSTDVSQKRYRYTGKEKDEETGLGYHGARYYAAWLGRWERVDPIGLKGGINRLVYCRGNPIGKVDPNGMADQVYDRNDPVLVTGSLTPAEMAGIEADIAAESGSSRLIPGTFVSVPSEPGTGTTTAELGRGGFAHPREEEVRPQVPTEKVPAGALLWLDPGAGPMGSTGPGIKQRIRDWQDANAAATPVIQDVRNLYIAESGFDTAGRPVTPSDQARARSEALEAGLLTVLGAGMAPPSRTAALGLGDDLLEFSAGRGVPWGMWSGNLTRRSTGGRNFGRALSDTLRNADAVAFNLTGVDDLAEAYTLGKGGFQYVLVEGEWVVRNATNTELATVVRAPEVLAKTKFYRDGLPVETDEVLRAIFEAQK